MHMAQLMPLPLTVSCSSKIQIGFAFLVLAHLGIPGKRAVKRVCVCMCEFLQAILGGVTINVPTLSKRTATLRVPDTINPTTVRRIAGEGLPYSKDPSRRGDIIVEFDIQFPDLPKATREKIAAHLPRT